MQSALQEYIKEQEVTASELTELMFIDKEFDTLNAADMKALSECENLEFINFAEVGLKSIEAPFPALASVSALMFSNNSLGNEVISLVAPMENLESLAFDGNQITSLEKFVTLAKLSKLREISLADCPVSQTEGYRAKLFALLPQLEIVDDEDKDGNVIEEDSEDLSEDGSGSEEFGSDDVIEDADGNKINLKDFYANQLGSDNEEELDSDDVSDEDEEDDEEDDEEESPSAKKSRN